MWDLTQSLDSSGIQLEKKAQETFGASVADFNSQSLSSQLPSSSSESAAIANGPAPTSNVWQSPKYADDLISVAPKHRFLFKVHFHFNAPYVGDRDQSIFSFLVKNIQKPKVTYEYQKINMYNFRTEVLVNIKHEPLTIDFHDDIGNYVHEFFNAYRRAYSPISRTRTPATAAQYETSGMNFAFPEASSVTGGDFSATSGQLLNGTKNILNYIEIEQYFGHGTRKNIFKFINPRIENFDFDEAGYDAAELHSLKVAFNYDSLIIDSEMVTGPTKGTYGSFDIMGETPLRQFGAQPMSSFQKGSLNTAASTLSTGQSTIGTPSAATMSGASDWVVQNATKLPADQQTSYIKSILPGKLASNNGNAQINQLTNLINNQLQGPLNTAIGKLPSGTTPALAAVVNPVTSVLRNTANKTLLGTSQNLGSQAFAGLNKGVGALFGSSRGQTTSTQSSINSQTANFDVNGIDGNIDTSSTDGLA